ISVSSGSDFPDRPLITRQSTAPPTCKVASSYAGKGRPERKMAAGAASLGGIVRNNDRKYVATSAVFSSFLVVAAIASQVWAKCSIAHCIPRLIARIAATRWVLIAEL